MTLDSSSSTSEVPLRPRPLVLLLLDGWGIAPMTEANAVAGAKTPTFSKLIKDYPVALLETGDKTINTRYLSLGAGCDLENENEEPALTLTKIIADNNLKQLKITETERLAALTHFFNGHAEDRASGEEWAIVSSEASGHLIKPTLALKRIVKKTLEALEKEIFDLLVISIPTLDLVARGGDLATTVKVVNDLDKNLKRIVAKVQEKKGVVILSAAHGNAEKMRQPGIDVIDTEITANPVPLVLIGEDFKSQNIGWADPLSNDLSLLAPIGRLADLAPTILKIMGIEPPLEMTGKSLT